MMVHRWSEIWVKISRKLSRNTEYSQGDKQLYSSSLGSLLRTPDITAGLKIYSDKVYITGGGIWKYKMVVKAIEKAVRYRKVVMAIKKPAGFAIERTCLARYSEKLGSLIAHTKKNWEMSVVSSKIRRYSKVL